MIKKANLQDELFVVLLPQGEVFKEGLKLQQYISIFQETYEKELYPELHITLDRIYKAHVNDAIPVIEKILQEQKEPVEIELDKLTCYQFTEDRYLVIKLDQNHSLLNFASKLHEALDKEGLSSIDDYQDWDFHITIFSNLFNHDAISPEEFGHLCRLMEGEKSYISSLADRLEVWRPSLDPEKRCLASFKFGK